MVDQDPSERQLDAKTAALVVTTMGEPLRASTIRTWAARGRLHSLGRDAHGHRTYRLGDVFTLARARHAKSDDATTDRDGM